MRRKRLTIGLTVGLLSILIVFEVLKPAPVDWTLDFRQSSKKPNGCFVFAKSLHGLLKSHEIRVNKLNILEFLAADSAQNNDLLLYITDNFNIDSVEVDHLLASVVKGKTLFISALSFSDRMADTLNFEISGTPLVQSSRQASFILKDNVFEHSSKYRFTGIEHAGFSKLDSAKTCILGSDTSGNANFISMHLGKGIIYLHLAPQVFANNPILYMDKDYALALSAYFANSVIIWDEYVKPGNAFMQGASTPLRYILSEPLLKTAYILFLITLFLLIVLGSKRRQRIIPVIVPPVNASLEFVNIIAGLYMGTANNLSMAEKKFTYFCDYIRTHYFISEIAENDQFYTRVAEKSGAAADAIRAIFQGINDLRQKPGFSHEELVRYVKIIDGFYDTAEGYKNLHNKK
jgi:hypothetical protein